MKTVIVGDIHAKPYIVEQVEKILKNGLNVILVGDYVDDWHATPEQNEWVIKKLIRLKEEFTNQLTLLIGNHDLSEAFGLEYHDLRCAGFNPEVAKRVSSDIRWLINKGWLRVATRVNGYLVSHAGFTDEWFTNLTDGDVEHLLDQMTHSSLKRLNMCGPGRGGRDEYSGPLWADRNELLNTWTRREPKQIVGHTPVQSCTRYKYAEVDLWFIDTFSTNILCKNIGDSTILIIENNNIKVTKFNEVLNVRDPQMCSRF